MPIARAYLTLVNAIVVMRLIAAPLQVSVLTIQVVNVPKPVVLYSVQMTVNPVLVRMTRLKNARSDGSY